MTRLEPVAAERVADHLDEISQVWAGITEERLRVIIPRHSERAGFRFLAARDEDGSLAGFTYGYIGGPGQWWHDTVAKAMTREQRRRWLQPGHFELVELHVRPDRQRRGIGAALLQQAKALSPAGVQLHTHQQNTQARAFYEKHGFRAVAFGISPPPESEPDVEYHWTPAG